MFSFHNGIDISAPGGTPVYPVTDGVAHFLSPTWLVVRTLGAEYRYIHIFPVVREGQRVFRSRTVLGYVEASAGHLHFSELRGDAVNPLRRGHLEPYFDHVKPTVTELILRTPDGQNHVKPFTACGTFTMLATAQDATALPVPGEWAGLPVVPAIVSWTLRARSGRMIVRPRIVANFLKPLPANAKFWDIYARGTFQNSARFGRTQLSRLQGRFLFVLARDFDSHRLANGTYVLTVDAQDARENHGRLSETITVANGSPACNG
jgi:Peptidase family M23.